jgi:transcriptional regulator with XRE-family HTH domain
MLLFGERLKQLRTERQITQTDLGQIFEQPKAQTTIGTWESGRRQPSIEDIITIAQYFNVSVDWLFGLTNERKNIEAIKKEEEPRELKEFLDRNNVLFNGAELNEEEKKRMIDILTGLFWNSFTRKN